MKIILYIIPTYLATLITTSDFIMFAPCVAAIILTIIYKEKLRNLLKLGSLKYAIYGLGASLSAFLIYVFLASLFNLANIGFSEEVISFHGDNFTALWKWLIYVGPSYFIISMIFAIGEEIGWRGYLLPKMKTRISNFYYRAIVVGLIWGIWHIPAVGMSFKMFIFLINVCFLSIIYTYLYDKQNSFLPAGIAHAAHNLLFNSFAPMIITPIAYDIFFDEEGLLVTIAYGILVAIIAKKKGAK